MRAAQNRAARDESPRRQAAALGAHAQRAVDVPAHASRGATERGPGGDLPGERDLRVASSADRPSNVRSARAAVKSSGSIRRSYHGTHRISASAIGDRHRHGTPRLPSDALHPIPIARTDARACPRLRFAAAPRAAHARRASTFDVDPVGRRRDAAARRVRRRATSSVWRARRRRPRRQRHPDRAVLGADTVVVVDGDVLGKPADAADAARMLRRLSGRAHDVLTGVAAGVAWRDAQPHVERTDVWMPRLSRGRHRAGTSPAASRMDKAGAYAIQGLRVAVHPADRRLVFQRRRAAGGGRRRAARGWMAVDSAAPRPYPER